MLHHIDGFLGALAHALFAADTGIFIHSMSLFQFSADGLGRADLGADCATDALLSLNFSLQSFAGFAVGNAFGGTNCCAKSTIDTLGIINSSQVPFHGYGLNRTLAGAKSASDAGFFSSAELLGQRHFGF